LTRAIAVQGGGQEEVQPLDDVLVAVFPAPDSYTGEDLVEVHCHGGPAIAAAVRDQAIASGARLARAGEFTERAVRNGKMDLLEAEALAALLSAEGPIELASALESRKLAPLLRSLAERARESLAGARGELDHPLEIGDQRVEWRAEAEALAAPLERLLQGPPLEEVFREGVVVALLGPPNAGKSSLFNALIDEPRALVEAVAGTTRDAQPCGLFLGGRRFTIVDTAGIREAQGIEGRAVARALEVARAADMVIWVEDISAPASEPPMAVDLKILAKDDLAANPGRLAAGGGQEALRISAISGKGIPELRERIQHRSPRPAALLSGRQWRIVEEAARALDRMTGVADDLAAEHLARASQALASLAGTGHGGVDAREIYARFCVGK
jgi:tRNA modification GTPase